MTTLVEFQEISKNFGKKSLIDKVSFSLKKGTLTTLIGPNGAGKTTIAKLILGLEQPTIGKINISPTLKVGYVPQKLDLASNLPLTSAEFLNLLVSNPNAKLKKEILNFADFDNIKAKDVSQLSGGQLQKLLVAATLLNKPDLIILDEPTQSLDVVSQQQFYRLIDEIKQQLGLTIFMISHDLFTVMKNSDQVICLNGHICCSGRPSDISKNAEFISTLSEIGFYTHHHDHSH